MPTPPPAKYVPTRTAARCALWWRLIAEVIAPPRTNAPAPETPSSPRNTSSSSRLRVAAVAASSTTVPPSDHPNARRGPTREATHAVPSAPTRYPRALTVFIRPAVVNDHPRSVRMAGNNKA